MIQTHLKKIFSDTIIYGLGNIFNRFLNFLLLPFYTHFFTPSEYGIFSLVYAFWFFAAVVYLFGMETAFQKFFIERRELQEKQRIFTSTMVLILTTSSLLSAMMYLLSSPISRLLTGSEEYAYMIRILSILLVVDAPARFPMILLNSLQLSKLYTAINAAGVILNIVFNVVFISVLSFGIEAILYSYLISYGFILTASSFASRRYFRISLDALNPASLKPVLKFAHSILYYGIFMMSLDLIDRFFIGFFEDTAAVGIYSACYRLGMIMNLVISGFRVAWFPFFLNLKENADNKIIFSKVFSLFCYGGLFIFLVVSLFAGEIAGIRIGDYWFLDERYWNGLVIVPFILFSYFLFGLYTNLNVAAFFGEKVNLLLFSSAIGSVSNVVFNLILIPNYSYAGAAVATLLSYSLLFITLYVSSQRIFRINYEWNKILTATLLTILLFTANYFAFGNLALSNLTIYSIKILSILFLVLVLVRYSSFKTIKLIS